MSGSSFNFDVDTYINRVVPRSRLYLLPKPISWFLGYRSEPARPIGNLLVWFWAFIGAFAGLLVVEAVFHVEALKSQGTPVVIASLGAAAILEYNTIESPLSQPRNAILGQLFSAIVGVSITKLFKMNPDFENLRWIAGALAVGISSAVMGLTKTVHPPAGATALLAATTPEIEIVGWFLIPLILLGSTLMIGVACVLNNIQRQFPMYWWTPMDLRGIKHPDIERVDGDAKTEGTGENSSISSFPGYEKHDKPSIQIDGDHIFVPSWISLDPEQQGMLEILRSQLQERLKATSTRDTDDTRVHDS